VEYFHPEDEVFLRDATHVSFPFVTQPASEESSLKTSAMLLLIEKSKFEAAIGQMEAFLGVDNQ
jgi:hypothetical protein